MISENVVGFKCIKCEKEWLLKQVKYQCPDCGGNVEVVYDYKKVARYRDEIKKAPLKDIYKYIRLLPLPDITCACHTLPVGGTPLLKSDTLSDRYGIELYFKDDTKNPSASFKDRAGAIALSVAVQFGAEVVSCASTGNAGSSLACLCANSGVKSVIFVPEKAPQAKIAQLLLFGSTVIAVKGTYDDAFDLCTQISEELDFFNRSTGLNPWTREGKKTVSFEIADQMQWDVPDFVFVPVGDGNIISGVWKGFKELFYSGLIERIPRIVAVQSTKSDAVFRTVKKYEGKDVTPSQIQVEKVHATTIADSIQVDEPRDGLAAVLSVRESDGFAVSVSDDEILNAIKEISSITGIFPEPAGATAYAGLKKALDERKIPSHSTVVCLVTGSGLKDIQSALKVSGSPITVEKNKAEVLKILKDLKIVR
ncbi:MAG: threonine synthase [Elusimicrobia bacterium]|nr:threonine synthase [Elusimicrobiota bacterium]